MWILPLPLILWFHQLGSVQSNGEKVASTQTARPAHFSSPSAHLLRNSPTLAVFSATPSENLALGTQSWVICASYCEHSRNRRGCSQSVFLTLTVDTLTPKMFAVERKWSNACGSILQHRNHKLVISAVNFCWVWKWNKITELGGRGTSNLPLQHAMLSHLVPSRPFFLPLHLQV